MRSGVETGPEIGAEAIRSGERIGNKWNLPAALALVLAMAPQAYKLSFPSELLFSGFMSDDVFYYFKTAINIRNGLGSTFDGINQTNGYHPLWMLICAGCAFITTDKTAFLYLALSANLFLVGLMTLIVVRMFIHRLGPWFAAALAFVMNWNYISSCAYFSGLETPLYLVMLLLVIDRAAKAVFGGVRDELALGFLMGLAFLARTEFALFGPLYLGWFLYRTRGMPFSRRARSLALTGAPFLLLSLPFLAWNVSVTGHLQQISGLMKDLRGGGGPGSLREAGSVAMVYGLKLFESIGLRPRMFTALMLPFLAPIGVFLWRTRRIFFGLRDARFAMLAGFSVVGLLYYFKSYGHDIRYWHYAPAFLSLQIFFVHALKETSDFLRSDRASRRVFKGLLVLALLNMFLQTWHFQYKYTYVTNYHFTATTFYQSKAALWMRSNLPADATVGVWDAGYVGYFSDRAVVNLDGLINGVELYQYYADGRGPCQYALDKKLDYVSNYYFGPPTRCVDAMGEHFTLVYRVGSEDIIRDGEKTYVDWYVWRVKNE